MKLSRKKQRALKYLNQIQFTLSFYLNQDNPLDDKFKEIRQVIETLGIETKVDCIKMAQSIKGVTRYKPEKPEES